MFDQAKVPSQCTALVIGAGPAGSAAARVLAQAGIDVLLIDQHPQGRDKICGDGLIPDAHAALARLGVLDAVMARAQRVSHVGCIGPRGGRIDVPGHLAVLPRRELDQMLCQAAQDAGAKFIAPARFETPLVDARDKVVGARLKVGDEWVEVRADWVILATGAVPKALTAAGLCERHTPSGVALRGYVRAPSMVGRITAMDVVWSRAVRPGYGWIFPAPDGCFNIGVGVTDSHKAVAGKFGKRGAKKELNLREIFDAFVTHYAPAAALMREGELVGELKGAPLRCTLEGASWSRPGLLVTGEAAGSTYSFTGEGIGKALETGILAAEAILAAGSDAAVRSRYEQSLTALKPKFDLYQRANKVNAHPWLADLLIWRAQRSPRLLKRMSGVLNETSNPGNLISFKGLSRLFLE